MVLYSDDACLAFSNSTHIINKDFVCPQPMPIQYETGMVKLDRKQNIMCNISLSVHGN
jgi:hypothetical protein